MGFIFKKTLNAEYKARINKKQRKMKYKLTQEMRESLRKYFNFNNLDKNSKVNFIKKWGMSPGYMTLMYK